MASSHAPFSVTAEEPVNGSSRSGNDVVLGIEDVMNDVIFVVPQVPVADQRELEQGGFPAVELAVLGNLGLDGEGNADYGGKYGLLMI